MMKIWIRNLAHEVTHVELRELCEPFGEVHSVEMEFDPRTGRTRSGHVELDDNEAATAISTLHGQEFHGRSLMVGRSPRGRRHRR